MNIDINWGSAQNLIFFPLFFVAIGLLVYRFNRVRAAIVLLAGSWAHTLIHNFSNRRYVVKMAFMMVGLLFLFLALLRPEGAKQEDIIKQEGRDVFIALDVSRSMLANDAKPNRLELAKTKIKHALKLLSCERVGLILFSGSAFVQCPLTADYKAFEMFLDQVDVETISSGTTALDQALSKAIQTFESMPDKKNKLLVLVTDGEDFSSNLSDIKRRAQREGLHIFTLGVGSPEGAPVPLFDHEGNQTGHQLDGQGKVVISRLNEGILSSLARDVGGTYVRLADDDKDIRALVRQVHKFEKEAFADRPIVHREQQYPLFLLVSFICLACEWLL